MVLASCNGTILFDEGGKLGVAERGGGWVGTAMFIAGLLALIGLASGVALLTTGEIGGLVPLGIAALAIPVTVLLFKKKRRDKASTTYPAPFVVFDVPAGVVRDGAGAVFGKIANVELRTEGQITSSSKMLVAYCPSKIVIAHGTPFGDSVGEFQRVLKSRGVGA